MNRRKKVMWDLVEAVRFVRILSEDLEHMGLGIGIVGSVLLKGYSDNDLDLVVFPHDTTKPDFKYVLRIVLEGAGMHLAYNVERTHAAWRKLGSNDTKHVEVWKTREGKRVDLFVLS